MKQSKHKKSAIDSKVEISMRVSNIDEAVCSAIRIYSHLWKPAVHPVCQINRKTHRILISSRTYGKYRIDYNKGVSYIRNCTKASREHAFEKAMRFLCIFTSLPNVRIRLREDADKKCFVVSINDFPLLKSWYKERPESDGDLEAAAQRIREEGKGDPTSIGEEQYFAKRMLRMIESAIVPPAVSVLRIDPSLGHDEGIILDFRPFVPDSGPKKVGKYYEQTIENENKTIPAPVIHPSRSVHASEKPHKFMHPWLKDWDDRFDHDD